MLGKDAVGESRRRGRTAFEVVHRDCAARSGLVPFGHSQSSFPEQRHTPRPQLQGTAPTNPTVKPPHAASSPSPPRKLLSTVCEPLGTVRSGTPTEYLLVLRAHQQHLSIGIMPKTLERTRKQIAKKRPGGIGPLHHGSRDAKRLHKAQVRDERLEKIAATRRKQEQPLGKVLWLSQTPRTSLRTPTDSALPPVDRVRYFQTATRDNGKDSLTPEAVQSHIRS